MPEEAKTWRQKYGPWIAWLVGCIVSATVGAFTGVQIAPPPPPRIVEVPVDKLVIADGIEWSPTFGWVEMPDVIKTNLDEEKTLHFHNTPAGKAVMGDEDVFLWSAVRKVNNRAAPWYPNVRRIAGNRPIPGLYATGNCTASVMGRTYPGAGASIGASFVFAYIGAKHAAETARGTTPPASAR